MRARHAFSPLVKEAGTARRCRFRLFLLLPLLLSCAATPIKTDATDHLVAPIVFYAQDDYQCGPAALAALLNFRGLPVTPDQIAREIFSGSARGTLVMDMVFYAEGRGLKVKHYSGSEADVRQNIDRGNPLIALVDYGFWVYERGHFLVIVGYNDNGFILNSGKEERRFVPREEFLRAWKKANFLTLLIEKK